jgi:hypothetical protein
MIITSVSLIVPDENALPELRSHLMSRYVSYWERESFILIGRSLSGVLPKVRTMRILCGWFVTPFKLTKYISLLLYAL